MMRVIVLAVALALVCTGLGDETVISRDEIENDIENAGVRAFLENVDYSDDPSYSRSDVSNYASTASDVPRAVSISWQGTASSIRISTSADFSNYWTVSVSSSPASVYNLIPGVRYYYSVRAYDGTVRKESSLVPVGPMRMIQGLTGNTRDLGGWRTTNNKTIRYGLIYRGARLDDVQSYSNKKDIVINRLGVTVDLDLRGLPPGSQGGSGEKNPWKSSDPVSYTNIKLWHYFVDSADRNYQVSVSPGVTAHQYQYAIRSIINWLKQGEVVYFHCHGGADRTGTLAFLIEGLVGVSESDIAKDFELTTYSNSIHRRNSVGGWFYKGMVMYIRTFAGNTIQEKITTWAKTQHSNDVDPLTDQEIQDLKDLLCEGSEGPECTSGDCCDPLTHTFRLDSYKCASSSDLCENDAYCTGTGPNCPDKTFKSNKTICRPKNGTCDVAEYCTGNSAACPQDKQSPSCHSSSSTVTSSTASSSSSMASYCTSGDCCDTSTNTLRPSSYECRPKNGVCDVAEYCTGNSPYCPDDKFEKSGVVCNSSSGPCENDGVCSGESSECPEKTIKVGDVCRRAVGLCDIEETCNGSSIECPDDEFLPQGTNCSEGYNCSGTSPFCPSEPASVVEQSTSEDDGFPIWIIIVSSIGAALLIALVIILAVVLVKRKKNVIGDDGDVELVSSMKSSPSNDELGRYAKETPSPSPSRSAPAPPSVRRPAPPPPRR